MCGIIGFTGYLNSAEVLLQGLSELEYRGYDSAGIACLRDGKVEIIKEVGKVSSLHAKVPADFTSSCGIGHTRWATHGGVTEVNAHPHRYGKVTLIHNGIIENYHELAEELAKGGRFPVSETDTEIAALLLDSLYTGDAYAAIKEACNHLEGAYGFCIMFDDQPEVIYCIRKGSPLVATHTDEGSVIASDMVALLRYSKDYFVLPEFHIAKMTKDAIIVTDFEGNIVNPEIMTVTWDTTAAQKNGYKHFMAKEIHEQPEALRRTIMPRIVKHAEGSELGGLSLPDFTADNIPDSLFKDVSRIIITACGTAMHAGMMGKILFERLLRKPVTVDIASEFRYEDPILDENTLVITVSQSGETADTLAALRLARENGARTLSIVNVKGSSIARESDYVFYTHAGPEIAVASTKAYTAQLSAFYMIAFRFAYVLGKITAKECSDYMEGLLDVIPSIEEVLKQEDDVEAISHHLVKAENLFFIGRSLDYALTWEGSIKLKEITYIHSEAYAAGELKHGTLSLITDGTPVIALATQSHVLSKTLSNVKEVRARGAFVICVTTKDAVIEPTLCDFRIDIPRTDDIFAPFSAAVILQMIAYHTASLRGLDVDQPRNLAKSVTVE
ncbi:MAG: glutamine--fructose-6-phosphate transaminase (isomerizing) [Lachnospiraceae bacterium]|nr:glutamine--fructose-6-phosphate transaminase (isomerizing) [Lachnospiraceae bacterium]